MISEMGVGGGFAVRTSAHNKHMIQMALVYSYIDLLFSFSFELNWFIHIEICLQIIKELMELSESCFHRSEDLQNALHKIILSPSDQKIERNPYKLLLSKKSSIISQNLKRRQFQLIFIIHRQVSVYFSVNSHNYLASLPPMRLVNSTFHISYSDKSTVGCLETIRWIHRLRPNSDCPLQ